jgi:hypothetical protein
MVDEEGIDVACWLCDRYIAFAARRFPCLPWRTELVKPESKGGER